jgi:hypothetical protein
MTLRSATTSLLMLIVLTHFSCTESPHSVEIKKIVQPNPTNYLFNMPSRRLRDTVLKLFSDSAQDDDPTLKSVFTDRILPEHPFQVSFVPETSDNAVFGADYFKNAGTSNDIFLYPMGSYWYSPVYFHNNKPFLFSSSFAFRFKDISSRQTLITVIVVDPGISNGTKCCGPGGDYAIIQKVKPTSVEEYALLFYIGKKLSIGGFKPIQFPH